MKKCPYCSAELLDDAEFCLYCMRQLTEKEAIVTHKTFKKQWLLLAIIPVVFVTILTLLLFGKGNENKIPTSQKDKSNYSNSESVFENSQNSSNESQNSFDTSSNNSSVSAGDKTQTNSGNNAENTSKETSSGTVSNPTGNNTSSNSSSTNSSTSSQSGTSKPSSSSSSASTSSKEETPEHNYVVDSSLFKFEENPTGYTVCGFIRGQYSGEAIIPATYNGKPVTKIGDNAINNCDVRKLIIPEGVEEIGNSAFGSCVIDHLVIPSTVKTFGLTPFSNALIETITMKCVPTTIPDNLFQNCTGLVKINLPEGLTYLSSGMFSNCNNLKYIDIPESVSEIRNRAFEACWRLESINLKNTEKLGDQVFYMHDCLERVTISKSLKSIGRDIFSSSINLTDIYYSGTKAEWESINKDDSWINEIMEFTIHCSDGDIEVNIIKDLEN